VRTCTNDDRAEDTATKNSKDILLRNAEYDKDDQILKAKDVARTLKVTELNDRLDVCTGSDSRWSATCVTVGLDHNTAML
jgi:hypothetical protein